jgi:cytochrome c553
VANYFAAKPWPAKKAAAGAAPAAPPAEKIAVCKACHQPNFEGGAPAPRLAGLSYEYLLAAMNGFADGTRTNNLDMPTLMKALTPAERDQIAHYLAAL